MVFVSLMAATLVSEDVACITAGLLIQQGHIGLGPGILSCALGIVLGDVGLWCIGRAAARVPGRRRLASRPDPRWAAWLTRGAPAAIMASRLLPGTRLPLYIAAGLIGVPLATFTASVCAAVALWVPGLVLSSAGIGAAVFSRLETAAERGWAYGLLVATLVLLVGAVRALTTASSRQRLAARLSRWRRWEFWPMWVFYAPVVAWIGWLALRHRGFCTLTAANPGIPDGGTVGESKFRIVSLLPAEFTIASALVPPGTPFQRLDYVLDVLFRRDWGLPLVLKPDVGQRGAGVRLARSIPDIKRYLARETGPVLMQPYHAGPFEAGIFYYRFPGEARGRILSITDKHFPAIVGDGRSTIEQLVLAHPRFRLQADLFLARHDRRLGRVLRSGERFQLALAGNHAQGTLFRDGMHLWTPALEQRVDAIAQSYPGFFVGRFDVRYRDVEEFRAGRDLAIVELNGATAESTDIYDPGWTLRSAYRRLFQQWSIVFAIGAANRAAGAPVTSTRRLFHLLRAHLTRTPAFALSD